MPAERIHRGMRVRSKVAHRGRLVTREGIVEHIGVAITTAGRVDDPKAVRLRCRTGRITVH